MSSTTPLKRSGQDFPPVDVGGDGDLHAVFVTSFGEITTRLFEDKAPRTVANFVALATGRITWEDPRTAKQSRQPLYDGTLFHRVVPNFMIQGGDPLGKGVGGPGYRVADEFHATLRHHKPGILSMANQGPNTGGSQFFITEVATPWLDNKHSVFGEVVNGLDVVRVIARVRANPATNRPNEDVLLHTVRVCRVPRATT